MRCHTGPESNKGLLTLRAYHQPRPNAPGPQHFAATCCTNATGKRATRPLTSISTAGKPGGSDPLAITCSGRFERETPFRCSEQGVIEQGVALMSFHPHAHPVFLWVSAAAQEGYYGRAGGALGAYQAGVYEALLMPTSIPTGSLAFPLAPSTQPSSRETKRPSGSPSCAPSGRRSPQPAARLGCPRHPRLRSERRRASVALQPA
jgi:hypothetical protein